MEVVVDLDKTEVKIPMEDGDQEPLRPWSDSLILIMSNLDIHLS